MRVTVAICTYNRADLLDRSVPAVCRQCDGVADVTVLVVDNASTDATQDVLRRLREAHRFDVVAEPTPGLSQARNTALTYASDGFTFFLDDDAVVQPGWLAAMTEATTTGATMLAGRVTLSFAEAQEPRWLRRSARAQALLSALDLGPRPRALADIETPVGANLGVDTAAAVAAGGFASSLGRVQGSLASMEEVDLMLRLRAEHGVDTARWVPASEVHHLVPIQRATRSFLLRRAYWQGRSTEVVTRARGAGTSPPLRKSAAAVRHAVRGLAHPSSALDHALDAAFELGRARQSAAHMGA